MSQSEREGLSNAQINTAERWFYFPLFKNDKFNKLKDLKK